MSNLSWIDALADLQQQGEPCVLVTIIEERGSTPRNAGSKMVVSRERLYDTIGGGHLSTRPSRSPAKCWKRAAVTPAWSASPSVPASASAAVAPRCCCSSPWASRRRISPCSVPGMSGARWCRCWPACRARCAGSIRAITNFRRDSTRRGKVVNDDVVEEVDNMPAGSYFIVMTHNHQLDLELTAAILSRNDFTYYGLIGSKSKRARFEHRLRDRGFQPETVQRMRCPMGIAEVKGKLPVEIAVSIAGEVIATYNAHFGEKGGEKAEDGEKPVPMLVPLRAAPRPTDHPTLLQARHRRRPAHVNASPSYNDFRESPCQAPKPTVPPCSTALPTRAKWASSKPMNTSRTACWSSRTARSRASATPPNCCRPWRPAPRLSNTRTR